MVSEISIHGQLAAALFLSWAETGNHSGRPWQSKIAHLGMVRYETEKKGRKEGEGKSPGIR